MVSVQFCENFTRPPFCGGWTKRLQTFTRHFFWEWPQNNALPSLLLFSCSCYLVDIDNIQWNKVAASTARKFNNSRLLYLNFSNLKNLCPKFWTSAIVTLKKEQKTTPKKHKSFAFLRGRYFVMGGPIGMNVDAFWETSVGF